MPTLPGQIVVDDEQATESANAVWLPPLVVDIALATSYTVCSATLVHWSDNSLTGNPNQLACKPPA